MAKPSLPRLAAVAVALFARRTPVAAGRIHGSVVTQQIEKLPGLDGTNVRHNAPCRPKDLSGAFRKSTPHHLALGFGDSKGREHKHGSHDKESFSVSFVYWLGGKLKPW
jgi:hypothetical protein